MVDDAFGVLWRYLVVTGTRGPSDVIFCFGSRDHTVPARAAELYLLGVAPWILVSGGPLFDGARTEAESFADDLRSFGVPEDRIIVENGSTNTGENVRFGMAELSARVPVHRVTTVSWPLAARRCQATFGRWFPAVEVRSAPPFGDDPADRWPATDRTVRASLGEYDRLGRYASMGFIRQESIPRSVRRAARVLRSSPVAGRVSPFSEDLTRLHQRPVRGDHEHTALVNDGAGDSVI